MWEDLTHVPKLPTVQKKKKKKKKKILCLALIDWLQVFCLLHSFFSFFSEKKCLRGGSNPRPKLPSVPKKVSLFCFDCLIAFLLCKALFLILWNEVVLPWLFNRMIILCGNAFFFFNFQRRKRSVFEEIRTHAHDYLPFQRKFRCLALIVQTQFLCILNRELCVDISACGIIQQSPTHWPTGGFQYSRQLI